MQYQVNVQKLKGEYLNSSVRSDEEERTESILPNPDDKFTLVGSQITSSQDLHKLSNGKSIPMNKNNSKYES